MGILRPDAYPRTCPLDGYGVKCGGWWELHHIIGKGKARGNKELRKAIDHPALTIFICHAHNFSRWADTSEARRILLQKKTEEHGEYFMQVLVDGLPWKYRPPEFRWEAMA